MRKIRPAAHTAANVVTSISATDSRICQTGGPGPQRDPQQHQERRRGREQRQRQRELPSGARSTERPGEHRDIMSSITGVIMFCESLRSLHAAPIGDEDRAEDQHRHRQEEQEPAGHRRRDAPRVAPVVLAPPPARRRCRWPPAAATRRRMPISLPIISWNGETDPISTSLMRLIFSSMTLLSSCGALAITIDDTSGPACRRERRRRGRWSTSSAA